MTQPEPRTRTEHLTPELELRGINVIRGLAMDAVQQANSGHPGTAMALAPLAHVLWTRIMRYDTSDLDWPDRDRFVLSCGHASILLYSMLYLTGAGLTLDDLQSFRQWKSNTPGHPEHGHVPGVDTTTGPLGQGFGNAVGMALAERSMRARFGADISDHYIFGICSDGDLQEGISHEAASLAGHQQLDRLIFVYDDNRITIDGPTSLSYSDDVPARFRAYGWNVIEMGEVANDLDAIESSLRAAMANAGKPSLLVLRSHIGYPSPKFTDTAAAHGAPFGHDEVRVTKELLGLPSDEAFHVPDDVLAMYRQAGVRHRNAAVSWHERSTSNEVDKDRLDASLRGRPLPSYRNNLPTFEVGTSLATRQAMGKLLSAIANDIPGLLAGGGDVTANTGTAIDGADVCSPEHPGGSQMYWGVREHGMASAMVGAAMHGGVLPIGGIFFVFSDYQRPVFRLAVMNSAHALFVWTHDSLGVGEDGPTHQPVEHLASLRAIPGLRVLRPADANETLYAVRYALEHDGPFGLVLTRQSVPTLKETVDRYDDFSAGGYIVRHEHSDVPDVVLVATGSEVSISLAAADLLAADEIDARVVSLPSWELFDASGVSYHEDILPDGVPTVSVEAATSFGWSRWADTHVSVDSFGESAPGNVVLEQFGFTPTHVAQVVRTRLGKSPKDVKGLA